MIGLLLAVLGLFAIIVFGSLQIADHAMRQMFVGFLSVASLISMFASPLFIIVSLFPPLECYKHPASLCFCELIDLPISMCFTETGDPDKER